MGMDIDCLRKTYVKFRYVPPLKPEVPKDCKVIKISKEPKIHIGDPQSQQPNALHHDEIIGQNLVCEALDGDKMGVTEYVWLLVQVSSFIEWEVEFVNIQGKTVREKHGIFVSLPVMFKIPGPKIFLTALIRKVPIALRLPVYGSQIWTAFKKLSEVEETLALILALKKSLCPQDIKELENDLKKSMDALNKLIQRFVHQRDPEAVVQKMHDLPGDSAVFVGSRIA